MTDPRVAAYARLLVDYCVGVQPGWQVIVNGSVAARPLVEELARAIGERGAYALTRIVFGQWGPPLEPAWVQAAPLELLGTLAPIERAAIDQMDARITIMAPERSDEGALVDAERVAQIERAFEPLFARAFGGEVPTVACQFPSPALAAEAGMTAAEFEDFLYGACLLEWDALAREMASVRDRFDAADEVHVLAPGTDITFSLAGRRGEIEDGHVNMPGGEVFYAPVEDSANGVVTFELPATYLGRPVEEARLVFSHGRVVEASAARGGDVLDAVLTTDDGAAALGEFGIGCNPAITRYMCNPYFDEKIGGTIHLALGRGYERIGGTNESVIHWDLVKDLRAGGEIVCDGTVVQRDGAWLG